MALFVGMAMDDDVAKNKYKYNKDGAAFDSNYNNTYWPRLEGGEYKYKVYFYEGDSDLGYPYTNSGTRLFGTDGKIYRCYSTIEVDSHSYSNTYRPITGRTWRGYFLLDNDQSNISDVIEWPTTEADGKVKMYSRRKASLKTNGVSIFPYTYTNRSFSVSKQDIFDAVKVAMDVFTSLNFGVTFTHVPESATKDYFETTEDTFDVYGRESNAPEKRYSIVVTGYLGKNNGEAYYPLDGKIGKIRIRLMDYYQTGWGTGGMAANISNVKNAHTTLVLHEVLHTLGLAHEHAFEAISLVGGSSNMYGNRNIYRMPISTGRIHRTDQKSLYGQLGDNEDKVCGLDILYNNLTNVVMKITGNVHVDYNSLYETGKCQALLADKYGLIRYRVPVDKTGYFEFRIRIKDWTTSDTTQGFSLIVVSAEFFYNCLFGERNSSGTVVNVNKPNGTLTYGIYPTRITSSGETSITGANAIKMNKTVTTFSDLYNDTGIYFLYTDSSGETYTGKSQTLIAKDKKIDLEIKQVPGCKIF